LSNTLSFVNLDYRCTNLEVITLNRVFYTSYWINMFTYKIVILIILFYMVLDQYAPT
jgi:hypothetical protein